MNDSILQFYTADGPTQSGLTFDNIMEFSFSGMELNHDYIQWLFPTMTPSACVEGSPVLDEETTTELLANPVFRKRFNLAIKKLFKFWDIEFDEETLKISALKNPWFMTRNNHNFKRMARFMTACSMFGYKDVAHDLFDKLLE